MQTSARVHHSIIASVAVPVAALSVAAVRRERLVRGLVMTAAAVSGLLLVAGCGDGGSSSNAALLPTPSKATASVAKAAHHSPVGRCHLVGAKVLSGAVDHSKPVPCTRRHNVETAGVHPVYTKLTNAARNGYLGTCFADAGGYLGLQVPELDRINVIVVAAPDAGGHGVARCDLAVTRGVSKDGLVGPPVITRTSLRQEARTGHTESWHWCTNARIRTPSSPLSLEGAGGVMFVSCTRPHRAEAEFHNAEVTAVGRIYPAPATLSKQGHAACQRGLEGRRDADQLQVFGLWESRSDWITRARPSTIGGVCWFYRTDGHMLPAVR